MQTIKNIFKAVIIVVFSVLSVIFSEEASTSIVESINVCINVIIPSMFIFMVISSYIISEKLYEFIFSPIYIIFKKFIRLEKQGFSIFMLSLIGGYPVGLKLIKETIAQNKNYSEISDKFAAFSYCVSPSFAIIMIGIGLYKNPQAGILIYVSNIISAIIMAVIYSHIYDLKVLPTKYSEGNGLVNAVRSSASSLFGICAIILFFNVIITVSECFLTAIGITLPTQVKAILEISNILKINLSSPASLPFVSSLVSFGGVCVVFQCISIVNGRFQLKSFIKARLFACFLNYLITKILLIFWEIYIPAYTNCDTFIFEFNESKAVFVFLLIMCVILMQKSEKIFKKG